MVKVAPETVSGIFDCDYNNLESLAGAPEKVGGDFYCSNNNLTSLEGAPETVRGDFWCKHNPGPNGDGFTEDDIRAVCDVKGEIYV